MEAKAYCDAMSAELMAWKDRMNDVMKKFDAASCGEKQWVVPYINDLHILIEELDDKIQSLNTECATDLEKATEWPEGEPGFSKSRRGDFWRTVSAVNVG